MQKSGYLTKRGGMRHNWLRRWCVLDTQRLALFESEDAGRAKGAIGPSCRCAQPEEMEIVAKERVYRLRADTAEQRNAWLAMLRGAPPHGKARAKEADPAAEAVRLAPARKPHQVCPPAPPRGTRCRPCLVWPRRAPGGSQLGKNG